MVLCVGALALSSSPASLLRARKVSREYAQNQPSIAQAPFVDLLGSGAHRAGVGKIRLGAGVLILTLRRGGHRAGGEKIRLGDFLLPEKALTEPEAIRSVLGISCSQERRSPGWGREDPSWSRGFNSYSKERRSPGWRWEDPSRGFLAPRRGAHRAGGDKIRLGDFLLPGEVLAGLKTIRSVSGISCSQERRSPGLGSGRSVLEQGF